MNVLLIDDSVAILNRIQFLLQDVPCIEQIHTALNAFEGWEIITNKSPEIVLLDIQMPEKNGLELLKEIKQHYTAINVVMITNESTDYYKPICVKYGADFFLDKSNEFEYIPTIIEKIAKGTA